MNRRIGLLVVQKRLNCADHWEVARLVAPETTSHTGHLAGKETTGSGNHLICQSRIAGIGMLEDQTKMGYTGSLAGRRKMACVGYQVERSRTGSADQGYSASHNCFVRTGTPPACFAQFGHIGSCQSMIEGYSHLNVDQVVGIARSMARTG